MGEESGGGPSGASVRGQVGLTKKEQNVRATAQEPVRGGRRAGAASTRSRESGFASDASRSQESDRFVTSTEGAYRDLASRAEKGQISERVQNLPSVIGAAARGLNEFGKSRAADIRSQISSGGTAVYDTKGRIQGVVSKKDTPFGESDVYTGGSQYDPTGLGKSISTGVGGRGIVMTAGDISVGERMRGGRDSGPIGGATDKPAKNVTGSTTQLSSAARSRSVSALGGGAGGTTRRNFIE